MSTSWEFPRHLGAVPFRFPSIEPLAALRSASPGTGWEKLPQEDFTVTASYLNLKVARCLPYFAGQMEQTM